MDSGGDSGGAIDLLEVARAVPPLATGADIGAAVADAYSMAMERRLSLLEQEAVTRLCGVGGGGAAADAGGDGDGGGREQLTAASRRSIVQAFVDSCDEDLLGVQLTQSDLLSAVRRLQCSVTEQDLLHYEALRRTYDSSGGGAVAAASMRSVAIGTAQ